ncbi:hypothetical protein FX988_04343 (plasmid) [Paraglaciecola mesophila]|uniref:Uncharacterized protein n=1 Tax=Paraglaciecola mesophila TaxID=197222 RepID=A0A857JSC5_9ALTE|nr:hypothetical protein [Paraglaciecola mesophila]QHJ14061.1 hypothetical protein FX988_04343 [Paraglaciecola mesophila]
MTIINREQLTIATQPSLASRAVLTVIVDTSMRKHGFIFPLAAIPFVTSEIPSTIGQEGILSNTAYVMDDTENAFTAIENLLIEIGLANNVVMINEIGGNTDETFYKVTLNLTEFMTPVAA